MKNRRKFFSSRTGWGEVGEWYNKIVGSGGHYYHQHVVIPGVLRLLELKEGSSVLDLGCGQGVLARALPNNVNSVGVDIAKSLIEMARKSDRNPNHQYLLSDVTKPLPLTKKDFTHAAIILSLQNIKEPQKALENAREHVVNGGKLVIVLNHPCFRIPRQSGWGISQENKLPLAKASGIPQVEKFVSLRQMADRNKNQYRWVNRYMTPLEIPINIHPGKGESPVTWTFHYPLSAYSEFLKNAGFLIEKIEEWLSDKKSVGKAARMENRSRSDIPLFLTIVARKATTK